MTPPQSGGAGHFESTYIRVVNALPIGFIGLVCLFAIGSGVGGSIFGVSMALVCTFFTVRGLRMGVSYSPEGVTVRGFVRTRRWPWDGIREFSVATKPVGAMAYRRKVLLVTLRSGQVVPLREQNASPKDGASPSWVEVAAAQLNRELGQRV